MTLQNYEYLARSMNASKRCSSSNSRKIAQCINEGNILDAKRTINESLYKMAADRLRVDTMLRESMYGPGMDDEEERRKSAMLNMQMLGGYDDEEEEEDLVPLNMQMLGGYDDEEDDDEEDMLPLNMSMYGSRHKRKKLNMQVLGGYGDEDDDEEDMLPLNMSMGGRRRRKSGSWSEQATRNFRGFGQKANRAATSGRIKGGRFGEQTILPRGIGIPGYFPSRNNTRIGGLPGSGGRGGLGADYSSAGRPNRPGGRPFLGPRGPLAGR